MPSKPLELYERRKIPKNGMKKQQQRRSQTEEAKAVYTRLRQKQNQMSLKDKIESLDVSSTVIQHEDHLLATINLNYTLGNPESIEQMLTIYDFAADEEETDYCSELTPTKTYSGKLQEGEYKIKISSNIVKNTEEIEFSITNMTPKNTKEYAQLVKLVGHYISSIHSLRYGNDTNKRQLKVDK